MKSRIQKFAGVLLVATFATVGGMLLFTKATIQETQAQPQPGYFPSGPTDLGLDGTAYLAASTTNTPRGSTTNRIFDCTKNGLLCIDGEILCTNANKMTAGAGLTLNLDGGFSNSQTDRWATNAVQFILVPGAGATLYGVLITNLTAAQHYPYYRVGECWNTNVSGTNFSNVKVRVYCAGPNGG